MQVRTVASFTTRKLKRGFAFRGVFSIGPALGTQQRMMPSNAPSTESKLW